MVLLIFEDLNTNPKVTHPTQLQLDRHAAAGHAMSNDTLRAVAVCLNKVTYKKNFSWTWYPHQANQVFVHITGYFDDAREIGQEVSTPTGFTVQVDQAGWEYKIYEGMYEGFKTLEMHELDEFFLVGEKRPHDPHRGLGVPVSYD